MFSQSYCRIRIHKLFSLDSNLMTSVNVNYFVYYVNDSRMCLLIMSVCLLEQKLEDEKVFCWAWVWMDERNFPLSWLYSIYSIYTYLRMICLETSWATTWGKGTLSSTASSPASSRVRNKYVILSQEHVGGHQESVTCRSSKVRN